MLLIKKSKELWFNFVKKDNKFFNLQQYVIFSYIKKYFVGMTMKKCYNNKGHHQMTDARENITD